MYLDLKNQKGRSLYIRLYESICQEICTGRLKNGARLPARRALAQELGISQNTVDSAYKMLIDTGYVISLPRRGYIVSFQTSPLTPNTPWENNAREQVVFSPNGIDTSHINRASYAKIMRDIAYNDGIDIFSYVDKGGEFELRSAISKYLYSFRNVKCSPDRIIIGAGAEYLLCALAVLFSSEYSFICENPCDTHFYRTLATYGINTDVLPVNADRFDIDALYASGGNILFIDPDIRFPRNLPLDEHEREAVIAWANASDKRYIVENCCDSEIIYEQHRTMHSIDPSKVIYLGSFSRSLSPAVKTSYMVLPNELLAMWKRVHVYYYALTSKAEQFALADFLNKGLFTKHYKTMRRIYKEKRELLAECLISEFGSGIMLQSDHGSTYITAQIQGFSAGDMKQLARMNGVRLFSMNSFNIDFGSEIKNDKLVMGIGDLRREEIKIGVELMSRGIKGSPR